jgi:restriction system protein
MSEIPMPTYDGMMNPLLQTLKNLGGSATIEEMFDEVAHIMNLSDEQLEVLHNPEKGTQTEVEYRLAWTRTYLKKYGLLENSSRGVWALTPEGRAVDSVNPADVVSYVREEYRRQQEEAPEVEPDAEASWRSELIDTLLAMDPAAFERLFQRVLRESGFIQVEVLGRTGDGGIDGIGILRIGSFISFRVMFQCKRWQGSVGSREVRDFRGAMIGRADKGLLVTTGTFTRDAEREAVREGAPAIDLIDGEQLMNKLKELELGVKTEIVQREEIIIDQDWLLGI